MLCQASNKALKLPSSLSLGGSAERRGKVAEEDGPLLAARRGPGGEAVATGPIRTSYGKWPAKYDHKISEPKKV